MPTYSVSPHLTKLHRQHAQQMTIATFRQMYEDISEYLDEVDDVMSVLEPYREQLIGKNNFVLY